MRILRILMPVLFSVLTLNIHAQTATITLSSVKQEIKGFGGINHPVWAGDLTAAQRETAFANGSNQLGFSVLRIWVSDNPSQWALELATAKKAIEKGAIVFASPWNPPSSMRETFGNNSDGTAKYRLKYNQYAAYATHLNDFVTYMKTNGVNLYAISVQNEPDYAHDWTWWTPTEMVNFLKNNASSINCKIMAPESFQYRKSESDPILNDAAALANVEVFGAHTYGTQVKDMPYPLFKQKGAGKELWMTEVYVPNSDANSANKWPEALDVGFHMHNCMVEAEFQAYVWWYIRRQYGPITEDGNVSKRGYMMAHYSKYVRPGYVRVDATKNPTTDVHVSAYKKGDDVVMVLVNRSTSSKTITLSIPGTKVTTWERIVTTGSKNLSKEPNINGGASFQVTLDAQSMTTFVGQATLGIPNVVITAPANNSTTELGTSITLTATATTPASTVKDIKFYDGTILLNTDNTTPYTFDWATATAGTHTVKAVVTDNAGKTAESIITIKVNVPQGSYNGTFALIPGKIEAEEYDLGGEGVAFHEGNANGNEGKAGLRNDEVDIENCTDLGGGYNIGYSLTGEWLEYTVNVSATDKYNFQFRVAKDGTGGLLHAEIDGVNVTGSVSVPNTGGWQVWQTVDVNNVNLTSGNHILKIIFDTDYTNFNYVEVKSVVTSLENSENSIAQVYPNPFGEEGFRIDGSESGKYEVKKLDGTTLEKGIFQHNKIIGSSFSPGIYLLILDNGLRISTHKIIKN